MFWTEVTHCLHQEQFLLGMMINVKDYKRLLYVAC